MVVVCFRILGNYELGMGDRFDLILSPEKKQIYLRFRWAMELNIQTGLN